MILTYQCFHEILSGNQVTQLREKTHHKSPDGPHLSAGITDGITPWFQVGAKAVPWEMMCPENSKKRSLMFLTLSAHTDAFYIQHIRRGLENSAKSLGCCFPASTVYLIHSIVSNIRLTSSAPKLNLLPQPPCSVPD